MVFAANAVSVQGLTQFRKAIKQLSPELAKEFRRDMKDVAVIVARAAAPNVPVVTGMAASSVQASTSGSTVQVRAGGAKAPYFGWLEFGGVLHPVGGRHNTITRAKVRRGRTLMPAVDAHHAELIAAAEKAIRNAARKAGLSA